MRQRLFTVLLLLLFAAAARAQSAPQLTHSSVNCGGGVSAQGQTRVDGTIGQPATGASSGGNYSVEGGFRWLPKAGQTIDFHALPGKTFGDSDFTLNAAAPSGLAVSFAAAGRCTVTGTTVHLTGAGSCTITASQPGDGDRDPAPDVQQTFQVSKAASVTNVNAASSVYDGLPHGGSAAVNGFGGLSRNLAVTYSGRNGTAYGPSTVAPTNAGDYTAAAAFAGDDDHTASGDSKDFRITKAGQAINFGALADKTFADGPFNVNATGGSSGNPVTFLAAGNCTSGGANGATITLTGAGSCTVTALQPGGSNYDAAADVQRSFQIGKASQTITFGPLADRTFGDADFTVSATASSGFGVSFGAAGRCTMSGSTVHLTGAGSCTVTAARSGDSDYNAAPDVPQSFSIAKAGTATAVTVGNTVYDGNPHGGTATVTGFGGLSQGLAVTYTGRNGTAYGPSGTAPTNAGDYTASASYPGDSDYQSSSDSEDYSIAKASQTITFDALPDRTFGDADFNVSASALSGLGVSFAAAGACTLSGSTVHLKGAGACTITASQPGDGNHGAAPDARQSFQVSKAATTTSLSSAITAPAAGQSVTFTATVASAAGAPTGSVQFKANGSTLGGPVALGAGGSAALTTSALPAGSYVVTAEYGGDADFNPSSGALSGSQSVGSLFEFSHGLSSAAERAGSLSVTVRRTGDTSQAASVDYTTDDGSVNAVAVPCSATTGLALERCDYTRAAGTLRFAPGETEKSFVVLVNDDSYNEGLETTRLRLSNPSAGSALGPGLSAALEITDDTQESTANPIGDAQDFTLQHYHDFLNRAPDERGLAFWQGQVADCGSSDPEVCRANVSAAFFLSIELQQTGYFVVRTYKAAFGDATGVSTLGGAHQLAVPVVRLSEFLPDAQQVGKNVAVGIGDWEKQLEDNKRAFALEFVRRQRFRDAFPTTLTAAEFVSQLDRNAGGVLSAEEKADLGAFDPADDSKRAQVLRAVAENTALKRAEFNRAFVLMQYFGYLRRDPDAALDTDHTGYDFWLRKLEQFGGDFVRAEMVKAFLNADEYRKRFGQ